MSLVGLPTPEEPFVDRAEMARRLHVHVRTLDEYRKEPGFPEEQWGPRTIRFQPSKVIAWLRERGHAQKEAA